MQEPQSNTDRRLRADTGSRGDTPTVTVVLIGVSGCGKSTVMKRLVERLGWPSAEADDFHPADNVRRMSAGQPLSDEDRWPWLQALATWIGDREAAGENGVLTCSALKRAYRDMLRSGHPSVRFVHLVVAAQVLERRLHERRGHYMPSSLLASQLETLEDLEPDEPGFAIPGDLPLDSIVGMLEARLAIGA